MTKSLWKLLDLWTRRARAHEVLGKLQNSFPQLPQGLLLFHQGDISIELKTGTFLTSLDIIAEGGLTTRSVAVIVVLTAGLGAIGLWLGLKDE